MIYGFIKFIILCHHGQGVLLTKNLTTRIVLNSYRYSKVELSINVIEVYLSIASIFMTITISDKTIDHSKYMERVSVENINCIIKLPDKNA